MLDLINPFYFIVSFCIGIMFVYLCTPPPQIVNKFPSPHNVKSTVYTDNSDSCYKYDSVEIPCNETAINQPIL